MRRLLMLQAFIDDSQEDPVFVMAGYIAPAERWALFSDRWKTILEIAPRLEYFKMKEAYARRGQFNGWSEERRNQRASDLYTVIEDFVSAQFFIGFRPAALKKAYSLYPEQFWQPIYFAVPYLMSELGRGLEKFGLPISAG
jgi:hypothetical protein